MIKKLVNLFYFLVKQFPITSLSKISLASLFYPKFFKLALFLISKAYLPEIFSKNLN